ncbi:MAG: SURF1 family cytochrome oxidase biogenesis protein [Caulobacterales bacterium]
MAASVRFRPSLIVTLVVLPAFAILGWLGAWQLQRKVWKEDLIAKVESRAEAPPMPFADALALVRAMPATQRDEVEFRRVRVSGNLAAAKPVEFAAMDPGNVHRALVALKAHGETVFLDVRTPEGKAILGGAQQFDGTGVLRFGHKYNSFTPPNDPAQEQWFWPDVDAAAHARGLIDPAPFFLAVQSADGPPNSAAKPELSDRHLGYALTWFGLAAGLIGVYLAWHYKSGRLSFGAKT